MEEQGELLYTRHGNPITLYTIILPASSAKTNPECNAITQ